MTGLIFDSKNASLLERPFQPAAQSGSWASWGYVVGNVHYRLGAKSSLLCICFGKVKSDALPDQLITFTRCFR